MLDRSSEELQQSEDGEILIVRIPIKFARIGGRKIIIALEASMPPPAPRQPNGVLVKAIARAHRWMSLLESGGFPSVEDLARAEKIHPSYVYRLLRLTVLAPDIVASLLGGSQPKGLTLDKLCRIQEPDWAQQAARVKL
jgi:hypothetical protein